MNQQTETKSTQAVENTTPSTQTDNLARIASSLEALVGIQRKAMAELYGVRAVADDLFEIERVRWLQEANLAYAKDITYLKKLLEK